MLSARWPDAEFYLVGGMDSSPDGISESEVALWHSDGHIVWHGYLPDIRAAIADSHVYVLPSYREGTPRTVLEAMAMRHAVVTTDAPGCR
jgi:glycosyltransferase involved in cell wall biosynthesis